MFKIVDAFSGVIGSYAGGVPEAKLMLANWKADGERLCVSPTDDEGHIFVNLVDQAGEPADIFAVVMPQAADNA